MKIKKFVKENSILVVVLAAYVALAIYDHKMAAKAVGESGYYFIEMLTIMPVIFILTSLIEAWVPKEKIMKGLGENSGIMGMLFAFVLGSFSAGPIYAAFPICTMLLKSGAKIANIVIILSTWAVIKVPMLMNEAKFLGFKFTAIRWVLTTISIFIIAFIVDALVKKKDMPKIVEEQCDDEVQINKEYCMGCSICSRLAPTVFEINNKKAEVIKIDITDEEREAVKKAASKCPAKVIKIKEKINNELVEK